MRLPRALLNASLLCLSLVLTGCGGGDGGEGATPTSGSVSSTSTPPSSDRPPETSTSGADPAPMDRDGDGFEDDQDSCPDEPGTVQGCPDSDGDGVVDGDDECPAESGTLKGCPDGDGDGFADPADACPTERAVNSRDGCPADPDGDGLVGAADLCPALTGVQEQAGCPVPRIRIDDERTRFLKTESSMNCLLQFIIQNTDATPARNVTVRVNRADAFRAGTNERIGGGGFMQNGVSTAVVLDGQDVAGGEQIESTKTLGASIVNGQNMWEIGTTTVEFSIEVPGEQPRTQTVNFPRCSMVQ